MLCLLIHPRWEFNGETRRGTEIPDSVRLSEECLFGISAMRLEAYSQYFLKLCSIACPVYRSIQIVLLSWFKSGVTPSDSNGEKERKEKYLGKTVNQATKNTELGNGIERYLCTETNTVGLLSDKGGVRTENFRQIKLRGNVITKVRTTVEEIDL